MCAPAPTPVNRPNRDPNTRKFQSVRGFPAKSNTCSVKSCVNQSLPNSSRRLRTHLIRLAPSRDRPVEPATSCNPFGRYTCNRSFHPARVRRRSVAIEHHPRVAIEIKNLVPGERPAYLRADHPIDEQPEERARSTARPSPVCR